MAGRESRESKRESGGDVTMRSRASTLPASVTSLFEFIRHSARGQTSKSNVALGGVSRYLASTLTRLTLGFLSCIVFAIGGSYYASIVEPSAQIVGTVVGGLIRLTLSLGTAELLVRRRSRRGHT